MSFKKQVDNPNEKWAKYFNGVFTENEIQMALKSRKRCLTSPIIKVVTKQ